MKFVRILFALLLCGSGHILKREYIRGLFFFVGFCSSVALVYFGMQSFGWMSLLMPLVGVLCTVFIWVYSIIDVYSNNEIKRKKSVFDKSLNEDYICGMSFYLKKEYEKSAEIFNSILKKNKKDTDAMFQLAKVYKKMGEEKKAKKMFNLYLQFDNKQWVGEVREVGKV